MSSATVGPNSLSGLCSLEREARARLCVGIPLKHWQLYIRIHTGRPFFQEFQRSSIIFDVLTPYLHFRTLQALLTHIVVITGIVLQIRTIFIDHSRDYIEIQTNYPSSKNSNGHLWHTGASIYILERYITSRSKILDSLPGCTGGNILPPTAHISFEWINRITETKSEIRIGWRTWGESVVCSKSRTVRICMKGDNPVRKR